ncbi:MAG: 1-acyl-sn-glycerol-3-phosphate acyltransferase [Actinobacteria bacterium]|nr:1-acyl-sn-glycerol-3-phosphate acyltransferase [Actinomycetota bacterium]
MTAAPPPVEHRVLPVAVPAPDARSLARRVVRPVLRAWLRLRVEDEHHVPAAGPVIVASTHASHADSMALGSALVRPVFFLGDLRLTRWPVLGPWLPRLGMVPVRRGDRDRDALDQLVQLLAEGHVVVVYPEGSRSRDGRVHRPRSGVARLAAATGVPVVPASVVGTHAVWPTGARPRVRGGPVSIRFGPPLAAPAPTPIARRRFSEALHTALVELSGAGRADGFAPVGGGDE